MLTRTPQSLRAARTGYAYQPPAYCLSYRRRRVACPPRAPRAARAPYAYRLRACRTYRAVRPESRGTTGDGAQQRLRQAKGAKQLDDSARFFVRQDGTRAYYFSVEQLCAMWQQAGFDVLRCE